MIDEVKSTKLPNGIAVLTEHMPGLRSVTAGIWVRRGLVTKRPNLTEFAILSSTLFSKAPGPGALGISLLKLTAWGTP